MARNGLLCADVPLRNYSIKPTFQGHGVIFRPIDALNVLCAQMTRELFAIAKFLLILAAETNY